MSDPHWLPNLVVWKQSGGEEWKHYVDRLYHIFYQEFVINKPHYKGIAVNLKKDKDDKDSEKKDSTHKGPRPTASKPPVPRPTASKPLNLDTFKHLISCNYDDPKQRLPDLDRAERIKWPGAVIEHHDACSQCNYAVCTKPWVWEKDGRIKFYLPNQQYLVIIGKRKKKIERDRYYVLITAYYINRPHEVRRIQKEYNNPDYSHKIQ